MINDLSNLNLFSGFRFQGILILSEGLSDLFLSYAKSYPPQKRMLQSKGLENLILGTSLIALFSFFRLSIKQLPLSMQPLLKMGVQLWLPVSGLSMIRLGAERVREAYRTFDERKQWDYTKEGLHNLFYGGAQLFTWYKSS